MMILSPFDLRLEHSTNLQNPRKTRKTKRKRTKQIGKGEGEKKKKKETPMAAEGSSGSGGGGRKTPSPHKARERGAAKFLAGLPSRGNFSSSSISSNLGGIRVYVCEHDTNPPEGQVITTDTTNILIRHLQLKKKENESKDAGSRTPGESSKGKRSAARSLDGQSSSKKPNLSSSSGLSASEEAISGFSQHTLQSFTVERLRALLRQRGLPTKGKKDELITRLREAQG